jgi:hypothetical protein
MRKILSVCVKVLGFAVFIWMISMISIGAGLFPIGTFGLGDIWKKFRGRKEE